MVLGVNGCYRLLTVHQRAARTPNMPLKECVFRLCARILRHVRSGLGARRRAAAAAAAAARATAAADARKRKAAGRRPSKGPPPLPASASPAAPAAHIDFFGKLTSQRTSVIITIR